MIIAYSALLGRIILLGIERILVKKLGEKSDPISTSILFLGLATIFLLPFALTQEIRYYPNLWMTFLSGLVYAVAFYFYVRSLSEGEASLVSPLYNYNVFFLIIISSFFLDEPITYFKLIGTVLLVYGLSFLNKQSNFLRSVKAVLYDKPCRMMILCSMLVAVGRVIDGFIVRETPPLLYAFLVSMVLCLYLISYALFTGSLSIVVKTFKRHPLLSLSSGAVNAYSYLLLLVSFTYLEVSIAEPASMLSMIVTIILAKFVFKEKIMDRMLGAVIMLIGVWLLFM
ncbi:EamA family transporter [candidate division KSB1 bacterium]